MNISRVPGIGSTQIPKNWEENRSWGRGGFFFVGGGQGSAKPSDFSQPPPPLITVKTVENVSISYTIFLVN